MTEPTPKQIEAAHAAYDAAAKECSENQWFGTWTSARARHVEGIAEALVAERDSAEAAVVRWLRARVSGCAGDDDTAYADAANAIERGEHRIAPVADDKAVLVLRTIAATPQPPRSPEPE
jgi:hypothetical protein